MTTHHKALPTPAEEDRSTMNAPPKRKRANSRIMYIENKSGLSGGAARIGRVTFSRTRGTLYYRDQVFQSLEGEGFKANYFEVSTGDQYWISGPKKDGSDRLYGERAGIQIDEDVREEYWTTIRGIPAFVTPLKA